MNVVKFFRMRADGVVEQARVRVSQKRVRLHKGYKRALPSVRHAENYMVARGWSRTKPNATRRVPLFESVRRALAMA